MAKGVFCDFYGTLVHEDGEVIRQICQEIARTSSSKSLSEIGGYWWDVFKTAFTNSFDEFFQTQRELETEALRRTIHHFGSRADATSLVPQMFAHWRQPPAFEDAKAFFQQCPVPVYIVSNIDREDVEAAIAFHGFTPAGVFTSQDARAYKPRKELFELALESTGLEPGNVVHIGDSLSSDVQGARNMGLEAIWLNRNGLAVPQGVRAVGSLQEALQIPALQGK